MCRVSILSKTQLRIKLQLGFYHIRTSQKQETEIILPFFHIASFFKFISAYETVPIGKISCKTVPFGSVSAFWDARNWGNPMVKKAFGRLMDGKNGGFAFVFYEVCG